MNLPVGFHKDIPFEQYLALPQLSQSSLKAMWRSPAHYLEAIITPPEETDRQRLGTLFHCCLLTPKTFKAHYKLMPDFAKGLTDDKGKLYSNPRNTNKYRAMVEEWRAMNPGVKEITAEEMETVTGMRDACLRHPDVSILLAESQDKELTMIWEENGVEWKGRVDADSEFFRTLIDFKMTDDARPERFAKKIKEFNYHWQGERYLTGAQLLGRERPYFTLVAVEDKKPHGIFVYRLKPDAIELAHQQIEKVISQYQACRRNNIWPGYPTGLVEIGLSSWDERSIMASLESNQ